MIKKQIPKKNTLKLT